MPPRCEHSAISLVFPQAQGPGSTARSALTLPSAVRYKPGLVPQVAYSTEFQSMAQSFESSVIRPLRDVLES